MNFKELLLRAKAHEAKAMEAILELYTPLLVKESISDDVFDGDLYQELCLLLVKCVYKFKI